MTKKVFVVRVLCVLSLMVANMFVASAQQGTNLDSNNNPQKGSMSAEAKRRIAGLNGCQIAYSLILNGINNPNVDRIPDGGISWALDYEQARIKNVACPLMPKVLSQWIQAQSLDNFKQAKDPFVFYRNNMPPPSRQASWPKYYQNVMSHYETSGTVYEPVSNSQCSAFGNWVYRMSSGYASEGRPDWKFIYEVRRKGVSPAHSICLKAPSGMISQFIRDQRIRESQQAAVDRQRRQEQARTQAAEAKFQELLRWKPSYRPPASEPRCYRVDDNLEKCFY